MKTLVVVDVQKDFCEGGKLPVAGGDAIVPIINKLMASKFFDNVVATMDCHPRDHISFASQNPGFKPFEYNDELKLMMWPDHCIAGSKGAELHNDLNRDRIFFAVKKGQLQSLEAYSGFFPANDIDQIGGLQALLNKETDIYLAGIAFDVCVADTALDALKLGYKSVTIIKDATAAIAIDTTKLQRTLEAAGVHIIQSLDIFGDLGSMKEKILRYIRAKTDVAVVGLSGGADSTLVAALCAEALGKENVFGLHMPFGPADHEKFNANSVNVANKLGIQQGTLPIFNPVTALENEFFNLGFELEPLNKGNMRSRMRMVSLYTLAHHLGGVFKKRVRVIGTGNMSEDFIGYDTKGGDALADFFPIGQLYKSEVYALLDDYAAKGVLEDSMIDRCPSAGLWDGQTDEGELGHTYNEMQPVIEFCLKNYGALETGPIPAFEGDRELLKFVWLRHLSHRHKHLAPEAADLGRGYRLIQTHPLIM